MDPQGALSLTLLELAASLEPVHANRIEQAAELSKLPAPPGHVKLIEKMRQEDPLLQSSQVIRQKRWNRLVAPVNFLSRSFFSLIQGNMQVLLSWVVDGLEYVRQGGSRNEWDRKLMALYSQHLEEHPNSPQNANIRRQLQSLEDKEARRESRELLILSNLHRKAGDHEEAMYYAQSAQTVGANASDAKLKASQEMSEKYREISQSFEVIGQESPSDSREILEALAKGDADKIEALANSQQDAAEKNSLMAIASAIRRDNAAKRQFLADAAKSGDESPLTRHAKNLNRSVYTNEEALWKKARADAQRERWAYALFNDLPARDHLSAAQAGEGIKDSSMLSKTISAIFFPDAIVRLIRIAFGAGPSNDPQVDAAAKWVEAEPSGPQADELRSYLAKQAERRRDYEKAEQQLTQSGRLEDAKQRELRDKQARDLFARIQQIEDPQIRQRWLIQSQPQFAGTSYEKRAIAEAAKLQEKTQLTMNYATLKQMPTLLSTLGWPGHWFDGDLRNREVAREGAIFVPPDFHEVIASFERPDGSVEKLRQVVPAEKLAPLQAVLKEYRQQSIRQDAAADLSSRRYFPLDVQGGLGSEGLSVYPSLQRYNMSAEESPLYR